MELFTRMACFAAAELLGRSADDQIPIHQLASKLEAMAIDDPELSEYFRRQAAAVPVLRALRAAEDAEIDSGADRLTDGRSPGPTS